MSETMMELYKSKYLDSCRELEKLRAQLKEQMELGFRLAQENERLRMLKSAAECLSLQTLPCAAKRRLDAALEALK